VVEGCFATQPDVTGQKQEEGKKQRMIALPDGAAHRCDGLAVGPADNAGRGLFATTSKKAGQFVGVYTGTLLKYGEKMSAARRRYAMQLPSLDAFIAPKTDSNGKTNAERDTMSLANEPREDQVANMFVVSKYYAIGGKTYSMLCLFCATDVNAGEELTFSYGLGYKRRPKYTPGSLAPSFDERELQPLALERVKMIVSDWGGCGAFDEKEIVSEVSAKTSTRAERAAARAQRKCDLGSG
jgi:hypothetical protein